jgi:hypothetical protein
MLVHSFHMKLARNPPENSQASVGSNLVAQR